MNKVTYIELFGKRVEGLFATVLLLAIWFGPFFLGYLLGTISGHQ